MYMKKFISQGILLKVIIALFIDDLQVSIYQAPKWPSGLSGSTK